MKPRVAVSQRCDAVVGRDEVRDALDIRLAALLWDLGFLPLPVASAICDHGEYLEDLAPDAVVLSGGNDIGQVTERDRLEIALLDKATTYQLPVLGICRGMQMINHYCCGRLRKISGHVGVRHRISGPLVGRLAREVNSYHDQGIMNVDLGAGLEPVAWSDDGVVEALHHRERQWLGIMWHPERDIPVAESDRKLIRSHLEGLPLNFFPGKNS